MKRVIITILMIYFSLIPVDGVKADVPVEINDLNRLISESAGNLTINSSPIVVVDHFSDFDAITDNADGVHPNRLGDKKMAKVWKNSLLQYDLDYSKNYSIMPLGDSITHLNYRYDLWLELKQSNLSFDFIGSQSNFPWAFDINSDNFEFDLHHEGHSGWRSDQISYNLENWVKLNNPDIVLLHIGTNDIAQGYEPSHVINNIEKIIKILRLYNPNVVIFLAQIIPFDITYENYEIKKFEFAEYALTILGLLVIFETLRRNYLK